MASITDKKGSVALLESGSERNSGPEHCVFFTEGMREIFQSVEKKTPQVFMKAMNNPLRN